MKWVEKNPFIMIIVGVMGIALSSIFVRYSIAPSSVTAAYRLLWTVLLMTPVVIGNSDIRKQIVGISPKLLAVCCVSGLFLAAHFVLWFESLKHTSVASSTTIVCTEVVWVALGFVFFLKGKVGWRAILAITISLLGSAFIAFSDSSNEASFYGDILSLLAAVSVAVYTLLGRVARAKLTTSVYTYLVYLSCSAALLATCAVQGTSLAGYGWSPAIVGLLLAVFSTILGHSIFSWCLKFFSPSFVSASKLAEPVIAAVFAAFLFGEMPTWLQILGGTLVLGGVLYYSHLESKTK